VTVFPGFHTVKIEKKDEADNTWPPRSHRVLLDDKELTGITSLNLDMDVESIPVLKLEMMVNVDSIDEVGEVQIVRKFSETDLNKPVSDLGLSVRAYNAIVRGTVKKDGWNVVERDLNKTVGDVLVAYKNGRLKKYYLLGKKSYDEVCGKLKEFGLIEED